MDKCLDALRFHGYKPERCAAPRRSPRSEARRVPGRTATSSLQATTQRPALLPLQSLHARNDHELAIGRLQRDCSSVAAPACHQRPHPPSPPAAAGTSTPAHVPARDCARRRPFDGGCHLSPAPRKTYQRSDRSCGSRASMPYSARNRVVSSCVRLPVVLHRVRPANVTAPRCGTRKIRARRRPAGH